MPHNQIPVPLRIQGGRWSRESEEVVDKVGEGGCTSILGEEGGFMQNPLPKHFGHVSGSIWGVSSTWEPICHHCIWVDTM